MQYKCDRVIETREYTGKVDEWIKGKQPILVVPKNEDEVRPVLDCSKTGLNGALSPWGMSLPKFLEFACLVRPNMILGKRDFRHGFHHQIVDEASRPWLGFDFPGMEGIKEGRFRSLPFGLSQSPAKF